MPEITANDLVQAVYCFVAGLGLVVGLLYLFRCIVAKVHDEVRGDPYILTLAIGLGWLSAGVVHLRGLYLRFNIERSAVASASSFESEMIAIVAGIIMSAACILHLWVAVNRHNSMAEVAFMVALWAAVSIVVGVVI